MFPPTLTAFQRKRRWAYWHIASGCLFVIRGVILASATAKVDLSLLRIGLDRIDIRTNCRGSRHGGNENNREGGQMLQRGIIVEHGFYMNASRLQQFSCVSTDRMGCSSISGLVAAGSAAAGPYEIR
jgi:hypothetical protein